MTKIISAIILLSALNSYAQKFAIIENKGVNAKYFNYNDPNSFVGVLMNNLSAIPGMVVNNKFQGIYDDKLLKEIGVEPSTMLEFYLATELQIYRPFSEDTINIIKTNQSLTEYLDSVKNDEDFEMIFNINRDKLEKYWNTATEGFLVQIRTPYYFDLRNLSALLIEEKDSVRWVHFIKSLPNGKTIISLSLTETQLKETNCFLFWQFLTDEESETFKSKFKKYQLESNLLDEGWEKVESNYSTKVENVYFSHEADCSQTIGNTSRNFDSYHYFKSSDENLFIQEIKYVQKIGDTLGIYRYWNGDTLFIIKTYQSFESYLDSMATVPENEELLGIDRDEFKKWWDDTKINDYVKKSPGSKELYRDATNSKVAISYTSYNGETTPIIRDALIFTNQNGKMTPIHQCSNILYYENFVLEYLNSLKLNISVTSSWRNLLNVETKKAKFTTLKKSLNLINNSTQF
jgi:hypothetical protein